MPWGQLYTLANWWVQPQGWYLTHNYKRSTVFVCYSDLITEMSMLPRWECGLYRLHPEQILVHPVTNISSLGKFDWGVWCVIIFLWVQFWIRLAAESYRGKKVRTAASYAVRSVNKSRDTHNCIRDEPQYAICVVFTTRLFYKALKLMLCHLTWQITRNYIVLTVATVTRQVTARWQYWA